MICGTALFALAEDAAYAAMLHKNQVYFAPLNGDFTYE
jgi:hypothetical protein